MSSQSDRLTLRDLPLPAKLVVTSFLISVGLGYLWAMAQIHFKHASHGSPMPTVPDLVSRFSGVPWPLEPKPEGWPKKKVEEAEVKVAFKRPGIKIKSIIDERCAWCHKPGGKKDNPLLVTYADVAKVATSNRAGSKGLMHKKLQGTRDDWDNNMVAAFFEESQGWKQLTPDEIKVEEPRREAERAAVLAWIEGGAKQTEYETDRFPLPASIKLEQVAPSRLTETDPAVIAAAGPQAEKPVKGKDAFDRWDEAHARQIDVVHLTQSTHAHLLTFAMLWAFTGLVFAFSCYSYRLRCFLSPLVLITQVVDVACWWLARIEGIGPYFAILIIATGGIVGLGLVAQITLSLLSMYHKTGRRIMILLFLIGAGLFGVTYVQVIQPQLEEENKGLIQPAK